MSDSLSRSFLFRMGLALVVGLPCIFSARPVNAGQLIAPAKLPAKAIFANAKALWESYDASKAIGLFEAGLKDKPNDGEALVFYSLALAEVGSNTNGARKIFERGLSLIRPVSRSKAFKDRYSGWFRPLDAAWIQRAMPFASYDEQVATLRLMRTSPVLRHIGRGGLKFHETTPAVIAFPNYPPGTGFLGCLTRVDQDGPFEHAAYVAISSSNDLSGLISAWGVPGRSGEGECHDEGSYTAFAQIFKLDNKYRRLEALDPEMTRLSRGTHDYKNLRLEATISSDVVHIFESYEDRELAGPNAGHSDVETNEWFCQVTRVPDVSATALQKWNCATKTERGVFQQSYFVFPEFGIASPFRSESCNVRDVQASADVFEYTLVCPDSESLHRKFEKVS